MTIIKIFEGCSRELFANSSLEQGPGQRPERKAGKACFFCGIFAVSFVYIDIESFLRSIYEKIYTRDIVGLVRALLRIFVMDIVFQQGNGSICLYQRIYDGIFQSDPIQNNGKIYKIRLPQKRYGKLSACSL